MALETLSLRKGNSEARICSLAEYSENIILKIHSSFQNERERDKWVGLWIGGRGLDYSETCLKRTLNTEYTGISNKPNYKLSPNVGNIC